MRDLLRRITWPHGVRCLWYCPPWHRPGTYPTYDKYKRSVT